MTVYVVDDLLTMTNHCVRRSCLVGILANTPGGVKRSEDGITVTV